VTKIGPAGALVYSSYLGGSGPDEVDALVVDGFGNAYVAGRTSSPDFPLASALDGSCGGCPTDYDGFVTKIGPAGVLVYSSFIGGSSGDGVNALAVDGSGNAYVGGYTYSTDFPLASAFDGSCAGCSPSSSLEGFVAKLALSGVGINNRLTNISTRARVQTGANVEIGGFIISGTDPKQVLIRARGPSMSGAPFNLAGTLTNPSIKLYSGSTVIAQNDNWQTTDALCGSPLVACGGVAEITNSGMDPCQPNPSQAVPPPNCSLESALYVTLPPGNYTAIMKGLNGGTGVGLVEVFEVNSADVTKLANISTRALVQTGANVMIGGFIIQGAAPKTVLLRARGPSMGAAPFNLTGVLANPTVKLYSGSTVIAQNDNWQTNDALCVSPAISCGGVTEITATGKDPCQPNPGQAGPPANCSMESALYVTLPPGNYSAIVKGANATTGLGLVEVFDIQ
jgi:hypothetical protein